MITLHSIHDLINLPPPEWLIDGLFPQGGLAALYGPSGHGKSFIALDWALCVAAGHDWQGRRISQRGPVVYVAAEGRGGIQKRVAAWITAHGGIWPPTFFVLQPVRMLDNEGVEELVESICTLEEFPRLVVIDTLARCFTGGDENETADMSTFVAGCAQIQSVTGATVMPVHHTGKDASKEERGNSAFRAAADTMMKVTRNKAGVILLRCNKQKDDEDFETIFLRLKKVQFSETQNSCVLVAVDPENVSPEDRTEDNGADVAAHEQEVSLSDAIDAVLSDKSLTSTKARAKMLADLTNKDEESCRSILRRRDRWNQA